MLVENGKSQQNKLCFEKKKISHVTESLTKFVLRPEDKAEGGGGGVLPTWLHSVTQVDQNNILKNGINFYLYPSVFVLFSSLYCL